METDRELLNAARAKDQEALAKIFDLYASSLYKYAFRLGHDPILADHIVGDVFAKLLEQLSSDRGPITNLRSYLYQATYHMIIDRGRAARRAAPLEVASSFRDDLHSASPSLEDGVMLDVVSKIIQNDLTEDQRHVIMLRFIEDFSLKETAMILGKTVTHIKVIQNRAIAKLRKSLGSSGMFT
jgi:RNA polymerase sigma-70 factor (ECF subfamily)